MDFGGVECARIKVGVSYLGLCMVRAIGMEIKFPHNLKHADRRGEETVKDNRLQRRPAGKVRIRV